MHYQGVGGFTNGNVITKDFAKLSFLVLVLQEAPLYMLVQPLTGRGILKRDTTLRGRELCCRRVGL